MILGTGGTPINTLIPPTSGTAPLSCFRAQGTSNKPIAGAIFLSTINATNETHSVVKKIEI
jgi:hypothetical protein